MTSSTKSRFRKDLQSLAKARGWDVQRTKSSHYKLTKDSNTVIAPGSPREPGRQLANITALMKRYENHDYCGIQ